jgi:hypothetical protein
MLKFNIEGIKSFIDNIKNIKINDKVKLRRNEKNIITNQAIGVYTLDNKKIGYASFIYSNNIDLNLNYTILNINLHNKEIIIGCPYPQESFIDIIEPNNDNSNINQNHDLLLLKKKLELLNFKIIDIKVLYADDYFIDINIKAFPNIDLIFYTVTKKYYDYNLLKYNEFYDNNLLKYNVYVPFFIHRLENYIIKNYKLINDNIKTNKIYYNHINKTYYYS